MIQLINMQFATERWEENIESTVEKMCFPSVSAICMFLVQYETFLKFNKVRDTH